jgi:hypothetical protein
LRIPAKTSVAAFRLVRQPSQKETAWARDEEDAGRLFGRH